MQFKFFPVFTEYSVSVFARLCSTAGYYVSLQIFLRQSLYNAQISTEVSLLNAWMNIFREVYSGLPALMNDGTTNQSAIFCAANTAAPVIAFNAFLFSEAYVLLALPYLGRTAEVMKEARKLPAAIYPVTTILLTAMANNALCNAKKKRSLAHKLAVVFATGGMVMFAVYYWLIQPKQTNILGIIFANLVQVTWMAMGCATILLSAYPELKNFSLRQNFPVFRETFGKIFQQGKPFVMASFALQLAFILTGMMLTDGVQRAAYQVPQVLLVSWFSVFPSVGQRLQSQVALLPSDETFGSRLKKLFGTAMAASLIIPLGIFIFANTNLSSMMDVLLASDDPALRSAATEVMPWIAVTSLVYGLTAGVSVLMRGVKNPASEAGKPYQNISVAISSLSSLAGFFMGFAMNEKHNSGALGFALTALGAQAVNLVMQSGLALRALQNRNSESQQSVSQILFGCPA